MRLIVIVAVFEANLSYLHSGFSRRSTAFDYCGKTIMSSAPGRKLGFLQDLILIAAAVRISRLLGLPTASIAGAFPVFTRALGI